MNQKIHNRTMEICPDIEGNDENYLALRRGHALAKYFPDLLEIVDKAIKQSEIESTESWESIRAKYLNITNSPIDGFRDIVFADRRLTKKPEENSWIDEVS